MYGNIIQQNAVAQKEKQNIKKQEEASKQEEQMSRASGVGRARQERKLLGRAPLTLRGPRQKIGPGGPIFFLSFIFHFFILLLYY
jgi:hypothetical protein